MPDAILRHRSPRASSSTCCFAKPTALAPVARVRNLAVLLPLCLVPLADVKAFVIGEVHRARRSIGPVVMARPVVDLGATHHQREQLFLQLGEI